MRRFPSTHPYPARTRHWHPSLAYKLRHRILVRIRATRICRCT